MASTSLLSRRCASTPAVNASTVSGNRSDRKSTRLNSSHLVISYAVFCLKKKKVPERLHDLLLLQTALILSDNPPVVFDDPTALSCGVATSMSIRHPHLVQLSERLHLIQA